MEHNDKNNGGQIKNQNPLCREIELLVDDYLEGMISTEDRKKMEDHLTGCAVCGKYIEETVILLEKAVLMQKEDKLPADKKQKLWNNIEAKIIPAKQDDAHIYNMNGFEDEYIPTVKESDIQSSTGGLWGSFRYYISGIAAIVVLAFVIYGVNQFMKRSSNDFVTDNIVEIGGPKWMVTPIKGSPMINDMVMKAIDSLSVGGFITTNDSSRAELYVAGLGTVTIEPGSKVRLVKSVEGEHRIALEYGSIDASIIAKPRTFFVDAASVTAVDLGCSYKFSVDHNGDGLLYVRSGMVSLESASGRQSIVPEGKFCVTKQDIGPGTPFREDSSPQLKKALMEFDFGNCGGECVNVILKNAKKTDAVTLVNIIPRVNEEYKNMVYQKAAGYCAPPKNITRDSIPKLGKLDNLNDWVDKIMVEVHQNIQENLERVEKQIEAQMKQFDSEKWQKEWQWDKNVNKDWNFKYMYGLDTLSMFEGKDIPSPEEMEELNRELQQLHENLRIDSDEFKQEMQQVKDELKRVNEEIRKELEQSRKETQAEIEREKKRMEKEMEREHKQQQKEIEREQKEREREQKEREKDKDNDNNDSGDDQ